MWDKILTLEAIAFMKKVSEETEDEFTITNFSDFLVKNIDYKIPVVMATKWGQYDVMKQANLAVHYAGIEHASRFIMLMDYLSMKFEKGELK